MLNVYRCVCVCCKLSSVQADDVSLAQHRTAQEVAEYSEAAIEMNAGIEASIAQDLHVLGDTDSD